MKTFCTIITSDYYPFAKVLYASLVKYAPGTNFQVLVVDNNHYKSEGNFCIHQAKDLVKNPQFLEIEKKYAFTNSDYFRWALKPIFISYLLNKNFDKVIFVDPDVYFIGDYNFLFTHLDTCTVLLTPHWITTDPFKLEESLIYLMRNGLFNAGFVGVSKEGAPAMNWWAGACHYKIDKQPELGIYVDQKYLDILPIEFPETMILQNRGCNIACWNMDSNKRDIINGKLFINKKFEAVFIHFTKETILNIINGNDFQLRPWLEEYRSEFTKLGYSLDSFIKSGDMNSKFSILRKVKRSLLIRTRIKRMLLWLSKNI
jgi:hypothetical protein